MNGRLAVILAVMLAGFPAMAAENDPLLDRWYAALQAADAAALGELLSANATVKLNDIGTSQTKAEFIGSMPEWKNAIAGGTIRHKADGAVDGASAYKVCYHFKGNDLLTREVFTVSDGRIETSEQTTLAETCADF